MGSGDMPILTQSQVFADFDIKIVLLGENSFEWIAFCWVEYCVF